MEQEQRSPRTRRKFSGEFKRDAVEIVRSSDKPIAEVACELGIYDSTLGNWVKKYLSPIEWENSYRHTTETLAA